MPNYLQKSVAFLYTNSEPSERESKVTIPFIIASKRIKYLWIHLVKGMKLLFSENYKTLKKEMEITQTDGKIHSGLKELIC